MARVTLQPTDENASATRDQVSGVGTTTDVASGGFPSIKGIAVDIRVVNGQSSATATTSNPGDVGDNEAHIEFSIDGGSSWTKIAGFTSNIAQVGPGHPETASDSVGVTDITTSVGIVTRLSLIQVRAVAEITQQLNNISQTVTASFTDWEITFLPATASIIDG